MAKRFIVGIAVCMMIAAAALCATGCSGKLYTVEYEPNGGTVARSGRSVSYNSHFNLDVPEMPNASFLGWYDSPDDDAEAVTDAYGYSLKKYDKKENAVVFARWSYWETSSLSYELSGTGDSYYVNGGGENLTRIRVPEEYMSLPVVRVSSFAFAENRTLQEILLPDSVTSVGVSAFAECTNLKKVTLGDTVTSIEDNAFAECSNLVEINVPKGLQVIGSSAFASCSSLASVDFTAVEGKLEIEESAFSGCSVLSTLKFNDTCTKIAQYTFSGCSGLTDVNVGDAIEEIESFAFQNSGIRSLHLGKKVRTIGANFTNGCASISSITVDSENSFFTAENNVLYNNDKTLLIRYASMLQEERYTVDESVVTVAESSFDNAYYIKELTIGNNVQEIEKNAFTNMRVLETMNIPFIGGSLNFDNYFSYVFGGELASSTTYLPETLLYVNLSEQITTVPAHAFQFCGNLKRVNIPNTVKNIGSSAFYGCSNLTDIVLPKSLESIGELAFYACMRLESFDISQENVYFHAEAGVLYDKDKTKLMQYPAAKDDKTFTVPDSVKTIEKGAFYNVLKLTEVVLPARLELIDDYAFSLCRNLVSVNIPSSVRYLGVQAFAGCRSIREVRLPAAVKEIGMQCFDACLKLEKLWIESDTVPVIDSTVFLNIGDDMKICFLSDAAMQAFKNNAAWKSFENRFVLIEQ